MSDKEHKASKGMVKYVLTIFVIAIILAVAYLTFFTLGEVEPVIANVKLITAIIVSAELHHSGLPGG
ncbi:hypothetical protein [Rhizobium leguminosarum]|uniref:hypothetical protein n=1 Tax=Rhizobium leguminosarum TaxID=384 RepID=UPI0014415825|nr:hypothetical protein [Rhizobium leguminosarum]MBY5868854.1 hypothetical protein [Rhizobium leguminosarum]NKM06281.1 hypothetical protein [Rhizobium leguminosarum bv. viciae]